MRRLIQKWFLDPFARLVIEGAVTDGDTIRADGKGGAMVLAKIMKAMPRRKEVRPGNAVSR